MTELEAKKIGSKQGLISVLLGLLIAQLIMTYVFLDKGIINAFLWFISSGYNLNILIGIIIMLLCGHFYGQLVGKSILIKKRNYILTGFLYGIAVLMTTTFFSCLTGFFQEGIEDVGTDNTPFYDYVLKPLTWIFFVGLLPVFFVGTWCGRQIKKHGIMK